MKKLFTLLVMVAMLLPSCQKIEDRIDGLEDRIDQIERTQIATINQQIDAINTTLPQLREADAELKEYIESLQNTASNLQEQITNTNKDIDELEAALNKAIADAEASNDALKTELVAQLNTAKADLLAQLESTKTALEAELNQINSTIATLQSKDVELEGEIAALEEYVNTELQNIKNWTNATFATLEQYNTIVEDIATIKALIEAINTSISNLEERLNTKIATDIATAIEGLEGDLATKVIEITTAYTTAISTAKEELAAAYTEAIATAIANLESSMKGWVNEQLTGYYTIAEVDAALELLENSATDGDVPLLDEINKLSERVNTMKYEITEAYQSAITTAITENNGVVNTKIATEVAAVNSRIDSEVAAINARIDVLEERIEDLEDALDKIKALDIVFDIESGKACMAGTSIEFGYTIVGGDEDTEVESFGDRGWGADVVAMDATSGRIRVTAPKDGGSGKVVVLATSGVGASTMKSIRFDEGVIADIMDSYEVGWQACTLEVNLKTNLDYTVNIPVDWITVADTRAALREETLTFSIAEGSIDRTATIELIGEFGDVLQSFEIVQTGYIFYICDNFTVTHSGFTVDVKPGKNNYYQWTYYVWTKSSYDSVSTEQIVERSLWGIASYKSSGIHIPLQTGAATICNYELLNNDSEYVLVIFYLDEYGDKYDNNYTAIPFKTLESTAGAEASLEVSEPVITKNGFRYDIQFLVKTDSNAIDMKVGAQLWNNYDFAKYWDPSDWSQIQAFFMFRTSVETTTLEAAKTSDGAIVSFSGVDKEDYVFFFEVLNDENTPTQYAIRVEPSAFEAME